MSDHRTELLNWIEAREKECEAATRGPWSWEDWSEDDGPNRYTLQAPPSARSGGPSDIFPELGEHIITDEDRDISEADRAFIASARTALPLALKALRGEVVAHEYAQDPYGWLCDACGETLADGEPCEALRRLHAAILGESA